MTTLFTIIQFIAVFAMFGLGAYGLYSLIRLRIKKVFIMLVLVFVSSFVIYICEEYKLDYMSPDEKVQYIAEKRAREEAENKDKKAEEEKKHYKKNMMIKQNMKNG